MTHEKIASKVEKLIDELTKIKKEHTEFDFALAASWSNYEKETITGDCVVTEMNPEKFQAVLENLVYTFEKRNQDVNYYGNAWNNTDNMIN